MSVMKKYSVLCCYCQRVTVTLPDGWMAPSTVEGLNDIMCRLPDESVYYGDREGDEFLWENENAVVDCDTGDILPHEKENISSPPALGLSL